ncbi:uncharacterized protein LOC114280759 isoform X3 [Camellia sinensis]|uniref:uncharacterized protein LOC114280759 isoform X3 n=1 Tax=Camellia sinensis TaxID=4442 RepID=UPI001035C32B|nr:uncharacterized protein LOC114280759 isoform X3 [Camellia sinensis]XP_028078938.1 uncharacterized protein LOC114280759 isoform X3 [Camellia sinensis]
MRFKRGSKVEVMSKKEALISWRCAEIISGNGHTYSVKYDCYPGSTNEVVERVPRNAIRPCPPSMEGVEISLVGDVVDVFDNFSWKIATVLKGLDRDHYLVRLLVVTQEFRIHKSNIRVRQSWEDNKWVVIGKGSRSCEDVKANKLSTSIFHCKTSFQKLQVNTKIKLQAGDDHFAAQENEGLQEPYMVSSGTLKRASPYRSSLFDACTANFQKRRAIENEGLYVLRMEALQFTRRFIFPGVGLVLQDHWVRAPWLWLLWFHLLGVFQSPRPLFVGHNLSNKPPKSLWALLFDQPGPSWVHVVLIGASSGSLDQL